MCTFIICGLLFLIHCVSTQEFYNYNDTSKAIFCLFVFINILHVFTLVILDDCCKIVPVIIVNESQAPIDNSLSATTIAMYAFVVCMLICKSLNLFFYG
jgi:hypothetical protein